MIDEKKEIKRPEPDISLLFDLKSQSAWILKPNFQDIKVGIESIVDLETQINGWLKELQEVASEMTKINKFGFTFSGENGVKYFKRIAKAGTKLYLRFFVDSPTRDNLKGCLLSKNSNEKPLIVIQSENLILPWDCFYEGDYNESAESFEAEWTWGLKYIIETKIKTPGVWGAQPRSEKSDQIDNKSITNIGIIYDKELIGAGEIISPPFIKSSSKKFIRELGHFVDDVKIEYGHSSEDLKKFLMNLECNILYIHCHADADPNNPENSWLFDSSISTSDIELIWKIENLKGNPFVFLNACEGGQINPLSSYGIIKMFDKLGARGIVGPVCKIPKPLAPEFARVFFKTFLDKATAGESLINAKKKFIYEYNNPLCLAYTLYGSSTLSLSESANNSRINVKCFLLDRANWPKQKIGN
jgi:hypothetical protein